MLAALPERCYSMAILLKEEGLYDRSQIYATDLMENASKTAKASISLLNIFGIILRIIKRLEVKLLSAYYDDYNSVIMDSSLRKNVPVCRS